MATGESARAGHTVGAKLKRRSLESLGAIILIALAVVAQNRIATWWAVSRSGERTGELVAHGARGTTPFVWDMNDPAELHLSPSRGFDIISMEEGALHLETTDGDPYLFLDLAGESLLASRYPVFKVRMAMEAGSPLQIHFWEPGIGEPRASAPLEVRSDALETLDVSLDLNRYPFYRVDPGMTPARWGGESGVVDQFRIDLGVLSHVGIIINRIALETAPGWPVWPDDYDALRRTLLSTEELPAIKAASLATLDPPEAPWVRVIFDANSTPPTPPKRFVRGERNGRYIGCFAWPMGLSAGQALDVARGWGTTFEFFEVHFPWPTPEYWLLWKQRWDAGAGPPLFPRKIRAGDLPPDAAPPLPGRDGNPGTLEAPRWGLFAGTLLFVVLTSIGRIRVGGAGRSSTAAIELIGVWVAIQSVLALFSRYHDLRCMGAMWAVFLFMILSIAAGRRGDESADKPPMQKIARRFGLDGLGGGQAGWTALGVTLAGLASLWILGSTFSALRFKGEGLWALPDYLGRALIQQLILCPFLARRFDELVGGRRALAAALAAVAFSSLHLPNFTLT
ncbi:MAG: hypothetical protein ACYTFG_05575, partial [Planctomycetota bacterium]